MMYHIMIIRKTVRDVVFDVAVYDMFESLVWNTVLCSVYDSVLDIVRNPVSDAVESVIQNTVFEQPKNQKILRGLLWVL